MILRLEMILVVSYERRNISYYEKHLKVIKYNTFDNVCTFSIQVKILIV